MKRIEYKKGDVVGDYGCVYLHEVEMLSKQRRARFKCAYCNNEFETSIQNVKHGHSRSCKCLQKKEVGDRFRKHGKSLDRLYLVRWAMINRCYNEKHKQYQDYGARGIRIHQEWLDDFDSFYDYMTQLPYYGESGRSIDRFPDNDGNYEPGNVRWATRRGQVLNQRIRKTNTSGYVCVNFNKEKGKWVVRVNIAGNRVHVGEHIDIKKAVDIYNNYIIEHNLTEYKIQEYHD